MLDSMKNLLFIGYEQGACLLLFFAAALFFQSLHKDSRKSTVNFFILLLFGFYITQVLQVTGSGTIFDLLRLGPDYRAVNLIPFSDPYYSPVGYMLNVIMLVPLGFLIPTIWTSFRNPIKVAALGAAFSTLIEISQLCNFRSTDVDDIILNTLGAVLGFFLYKTLKALHFLPEIGRDKWFPAENAIWIFVIFVSKFFLFDGTGLAVILW